MYVCPYHSSLYQSSLYLCYTFRCFDFFPTLYLLFMPHNRHHYQLQFNLLPYFCTSFLYYICTCISTHVDWLLRQRACPGRTLLILGFVQHNCLPVPAALLLPYCCCFHYLCLCFCLCLRGLLIYQQHFSTILSGIDFLVLTLSQLHTCTYVRMYVCTRISVFIHLYSAYILSN